MKMNHSPHAEFQTILASLSTKVDEISRANGFHLTRYDSSLMLNKQLSSRLSVELKVHNAGRNNALVLDHTLKLMSATGQKVKVHRQPVTLETFEKELQQRTTNPKTLVHNWI